MLGQAVSRLSSRPWAHPCSFPFVWEGTLCCHELGRSLEPFATVPLPLAVFPLAISESFAGARFWLAGSMLESLLKGRLLNMGCVSPCCNKAVFFQRM